MQKYGRIISNGVNLEKHERQTISLLLKYGFNIELIPASRTKGHHTADILLNNIPWEIKSPQGKGERTIEHILAKAVKQSNNIIIDLRRAQLPNERCLRMITFLCSHKKSIKHLKVITKTGVLIDIK